MELSGFSSFVEILTVVNFGYAGSQSFRTGANAKIFEFTQFFIPEKYEILISKIRAQFTATIAEGGSESYLEDINRIDQEHRDSIEFQKKDLDVFKNELPEASKSLFLASGIYCLFFLCGLGIQNSGALVNPHTLLIFLTFFTILIVPAFITFRKIQNNKLIDLERAKFVMLMLVVILLIGSCAFCVCRDMYPIWWVNSKLVMVITSIIIPSLAFLVYFLALIMKMINTHRSLNLKAKNVEKELKKTVLENFGFK